MRTVGMFECARLTWLAYTDAERYDLKVNDLNVKHVTAAEYPYQASTVTGVGRLSIVTAWSAAPCA